MSLDLISQGIKKSNLYSMEEQMKAEMQEIKGFGNSVLREVRLGNFQIRTPASTYKESDRIILSEEIEQQKPQSKFKQFLSRIGNSFKNFFRWKEKN